MKVLRTTDIVTLKHNHIEVDFSPLRYDRSMEIANVTRNIGGKLVTDMPAQTGLMIKFAVKEVRGVKDFSDKDIILKSVNGEMSDDDVSTIISVLVQTPFIPAISYISTSCTPKSFEGVDILINGEKIKLGKAK